jgi:hypothetical protein
MPDLEATGNTLKLTQNGTALQVLTLSDVEKFREADLMQDENIRVALSRRPARGP